MRSVIPFSEEKFLEAFTRQFKTRCFTFTNVAFDETEFKDSIKPFIEAADMMFIAHFIGEETYNKCRSVYDSVCERSMESMAALK